MIENYSNDIIQSFEYETSINSDGNILGTCELGIATIQMINDSNIYSSLKGQWIKTIHGSFYIYDVEPVQEKVNIKLSCYDVKYKLDTKYDKSLYTFPMTLKEWRNAIFTSCGVEYDDTDFPNSDLSLSAEPYVGDNPSNRQVISLIAQAGASFVITDENDKFYFKWFNNINHNITDWLELTTEKENTPAINVVVLGRGNVEDNVCYPDPLPENKVGLRIDNNYIIDPQIESNDIRYTTRVPIYNQVNGFSFIPFSIRTQEVNNKLSINIGDKASYKDIWGNNLTSYVMTKKITYLGGNPTDDDNYEITLSAEELNETSTEYSYASSIENRVSKVEITTDKQNKKINALVEEVDENTEKVSNLSLEVDKINSSVSSINNQIIPTSIVSGENIHIEDGSDNDMISLKLDGRSIQRTSTQNANLFDENYYNNNSIYDTSTYKSALTKFKGNRLLYIKAELKSGKTAQSGIYVCLSSTINPNISGSKYDWFINNGEPYKISCDFTDINDLYFSFYPSTTDLSTIFDNYNLWVSADNIDYIPFVPNSPSPDYPSEIESVGKYNEDTRKYEIEVVNTGEGKSTSSLFVLDEPLRSLPNGTKDELIVENGMAKVVKKVGSFVLNGSEEWYSYLGGTGNGYVYQTPSITKTKIGYSKSICSHFKNKVNAWNIGSIGDYSDHPSLVNKYFVSDKKTLEEFKYWLSTHNIEVIYELAEEEIIELGEIEMPKTYQDENSISNSAETNMTIEYVRDTILSDYVEGQIGNAIIIQERKNAEFQITNNEIKLNVSEVSTKLNNDYTNNQELNQKLEEQKQTITEEYSTLITQTKESWQASVINYINTNGVEKFVNTLVTIDIDGLKLSKSDEDIVSLLNNKGLYVSDGKLLDSLSNLLMKVDRAGALFKLLEVLGTIKEQEIIQKEKITDDKFGVCQAWYWIGE